MKPDWDKLGDEFADQRPKHEPASPTGTEAQEPHEHALPPALRTPAQPTPLPASHALPLPPGESMISRSPPFKSV